jgi:hypothetical protein
MFLSFYVHRYLFRIRAIIQMLHEVFKFLTNRNHKMVGYIIYQVNNNYIPNNRHNHLKHEEHLYMKGTNMNEIEGITVTYN